MGSVKEVEDGLGTSFIRAGAGGAPSGPTTLRVGAGQGPAGTDLAGGGSPGLTPSSGRSRPARRMIAWGGEVPLQEHTPTPAFHTRQLSGRPDYGPMASV